MPIPKLSSPEWEQEVEFFKTSTVTEREARATQLNMQRASYERRMRERGVKLAKQPTDDESERKPVVNLRELHLC